MRSRFADPGPSASAGALYASPWEIGAVPCSMAKSSCTRTARRSRLPTQWEPGTPLRRRSFMGSRTTGQSIASHVLRTGWALWWPVAPERSLTGTWRKPPRHETSEFLPPAQFAGSGPGWAAVWPRHRRNRWNDAGACGNVRALGGDASYDGCTLGGDSVCFLWRHDGRSIRGCSQAVSGNQGLENMERHLIKQRSRG